MTQNRSLHPARLSRRALLRAGIALGVGVPLTSKLLTACGESSGPASGPDQDETPASDSTTPAAGTGTRGGTLHVALVGEPPTLDIHQTTASITALVGWHMFEALFTWDDQFGVILELAETHEVSEDGLVNTIHIRRGVPFHNGEELTATDVRASIERWAQLSGLGESLLASTDEIIEIDRYTLEFRMNEPFGTLPIALARQNQGCAIYPRSVIDESGSNQMMEWVGTGPYKLVERQPDRFIRLERFEDYAALPGEAVGYGGHKYCYLDEIRFIPVPDEAARIAGLQAEDYHYLESITPDQFNTISGYPGLVVEVFPPSSSPTLAFNLTSPVMGDIRIRRAIQAALDHEPILMAGYGEGFYRLDPGVMPPETAWNSTESASLYNQHDQELARHLLAEANYNGEPIRFMTTEAYRDMYTTAVVIRQQLEEVGLVVDLQIYDWATLVERRSDPDLWDIYPAPATFRPDPIMRNLTCKATGWWCNEEKEELLQELQQASDFDQRYAAWEAVQRLFYEDVPRIKLGDVSEVTARSAKIQGFVPLNQLQPFFWNIWLET